MGFIDDIQEKTATWPDGIQKRVNDGINRIEQGLDVSNRKCGELYHKHYKFMYLRCHYSFYFVLHVKGL